MRSRVRRVLVAIAAVVQLPLLVLIQYPPGGSSSDVAAPEIVASPRSSPSPSPDGSPQPASSPTASGSPGAPGLSGADTRITGDDQPGSYGRFDGGEDAVTRGCSGGRRPQQEPSVAIDPLDPDVIAAGANDDCPMAGGSASWMGYYRSTDRGLTWIASLVPGYAGDATDEGRSSPANQRCIGASDPSLAFDREGRLFYGFVCAKPGPSEVSAMVATYDRHGARYVGTALLAPGKPTLANDKIAVAVDQTSGPAAGTVYATWVEFTGPHPDEFDRGTVKVARSTDHGASFFEPIPVSQLRTASLPDVAVGPDGAVYVTYRVGITIWMARSTDGGASFGGPKLVTSLAPFDSTRFSGDAASECGDGQFACPSGFTFSRFASAASVVADESGVHVVWNERRSRGQSKVMVRNSETGVTWFRPAIQIDRVDVGHQWFPDIASSGGTISVVFYDSRIDPAYDPDRPPGNTEDGQNSGGAVHTFLARSNDGGLTWTETRMSHEPSNFGYEVPFQVPFWGDYITVSAVPGFAYVVWADSRDVVPGDDPLELRSGDSDGFDVHDTCTYVPNDIDAERYERPTPDDPCLAEGGYDQNLYGSGL